LRLFELFDLVLGLLFVFLEEVVLPERAGAAFFIVLLEEDVFELPFFEGVDFVFFLFCILLFFMIMNAKLNHFSSKSKYFY
jgi:hypothetical protein